MVAQACISFGSHLLSIRQSSMTADDAQENVKSLFDWFSEHDAFSNSNAGIAIEAIEFGKQLLESRKTSTVNEAVEAIQSLYNDLAEAPE